MIFRSELEDDDNNQRKSDVKTGSFQGFDSWQLGKVS
jgi:hypothetical protein